MSIFSVVSLQAQKRKIANQRNNLLTSQEQLTGAKLDFLPILGSTVALDAYIQAFWRRLGSTLEGATYLYVKGPTSSTRGFSESGPKVSAFV